MGNRLLGQPNWRTQARVVTRQYESRLPREETVSVPETPPETIPEVPRTRNAASNDLVKCSHYGIHRHNWYPQYHFCQIAISMMRIDSRMYRCCANHKSWAHPTQLYVSKRCQSFLSTNISRKKQKVGEEGELDIDDESSNESETIEEAYNEYAATIQKMRICTKCVIDQNERM